MLEALAYLDRACLPFYHLHAGNVILVNGRATLTDIESLLIGLPPRHLKKLQRAGPHDPVVVAFCCLIYELATGNSLAIPTFPRFPSLETLSGDYDDIADVLKFVFSPRVPIELDKDGKPKLSPPPPYVTVHDLLKLPFFKSVPGVEECPELPAPGQTKQPSQMREAMSVPAASANYDSLDVLYDPRVKQLVCIGAILYSIFALSLIPFPLTIFLTHHSSFTSLFGISCDVAPFLSPLSLSLCLLM